MDIKLNGMIRNYIYLAVLGLVFTCMIIGLYTAQQQDRNYRENYIVYKQAQALIDQGQYSDAEKKLRNLPPGFADSYQVQFMLGICSAATGDYTGAVAYMQRVKEIRPAMLMDQAFLVNYGYILFQQGDYKLAKLYLLESKKYATDPETTAIADEILQQMAN